MQAGEWWHSIDHDEPCRVVDTETLWGQASCLVWLPRRDTAVRVLQKRLVPLKAGESHLLDRLSYVSAAARIADALERDALVAPLEGTVIPLPHQLLALQRAISGDRIRYLLADEVGLGKTIEAGLILRELKIRGLVRRILVVAPAGLVLQWQSEMKGHFGEDFRLILPSSLTALRQAGAIDENENLWRMHDQVICPLDSVKPMDSRRGWSQEQLARYNRERFEDLVSAGWDLIIIDEAHRVGGSTEQVARFKLGDALAQAAPYLLLLSATPHQGKSDAFRRLIGFSTPTPCRVTTRFRARRSRPLSFALRSDVRSTLTAIHCSSRALPSWCRSNGEARTRSSELSTRRSPNTSATATTAPSRKSRPLSAF